MNTNNFFTSIKNNAIKLVNLVKNIIVNFFAKDPISNKPFYYNAKKVISLVAAIVITIATLLFVFTQKSNPQFFEYNFSDAPVAFTDLNSNALNVIESVSTFDAKATKAQIQLQKNTANKNSLVTINADNKPAITFGISNASLDSSNVLSNGVEYNANGYKLKYTAFDKYLKEEIILQNSNSQKEFTFDFSGIAINLLPSAEGGVYIKQNGTTVYYVYPPVAHDYYGSKIDYQYVINGQSVTLKPKDLSQLNNAKYPIVIDPTLSWGFSNSAQYTLSDAGKIEIASNVVRLKNNAGSYATDNPYAINTNPVIYTTLSGFSETLGSNNSGSVQYQISNNATDWYWWDGSAWTLTTSDFSESSSASDINAHISSFPADVGTGSLSFKAFLHAPTSADQVELASVNVDYFSSTAPSVSSLSVTEGPSAGLTDVTITGSNFGSDLQTNIFEYTGSDQTYTVPAGVTSIHVKMWGGGGGGGTKGSGWQFGYDGGAGGYTEADIAVTPGQVLTVMVGGGGSTGIHTQTTYTYGGGGPNCGGSDCAYGGAGGGRSAIILSGEDILTAGGGGGGGSGITYYSESYGGAGGGLTAQDGVQAYSPATAGGAGTQVSGGAGGTSNQGYPGTAGSKYTGGRASGAQSYGSGGGGGWYGGGGGGYRDTVMGGGGGGSSYIDGAGVTNGITIAGNLNNQPKSDDFYNNGAGKGGAAYVDGASGRVVIEPAVKSVKFGGVEATNIRYTNSNTIVVTVPAHTPATVDVVVTNTDGQTGTLTSAYTYKAPEVLSLSSNNGSSLGGNEITITGTNFSNAVKTTEFTYTGSDQLYTVPAGVTSIHVKMWGAGGGGGNPGGWTYGYPGGAGGYSEADIAVTPGQVLNIVVGSGGTNGSTSNSQYNYGGGGPTCGGTDCRYGGQGGGRTAIKYNNEDILTAGGGGGGGSTLTYNLFENGGEAGGLIGNDGVSAANAAYAGKGGTQVGGGAGGSGNQVGAQAGQKYYGGRPNAPYSYGGSGGGGYYGGGGGAYSDNYMGGGGAGSSYAGGAGVSNAQLLTGLHQTPARSSDSLNGGAGFGGNASTNGANGKVIIDVLPSSVTFGGTQATNIRFTDSTTIVVTAPPHEAGTVDVVVTNSDGQSGVLTNGYTYNASTVSSVSPSSGPLTGNTNITIAGTNFTNATESYLYDYFSTDQQFVVPAGVTSIHVKMWGAGGAGGKPGSWNYGSPGGGGGYTEADISVTPGQVLTVMVGQGGSASGNDSNTYGGGGHTCSACGYGSQGGGRSAIRVSGEDILTAGGGGGGGTSRSNTLSMQGGAGGGLVGQAGFSDELATGAGKGGTQSGGGVGGLSTAASGISGSKYLGGYQTAGTYGGSGGGGWYGGGSGGYWEPNTMGGGGGGSSYIDGAGVSNAIALRGDKYNQANASDPDNSGKGLGGATATNGADGRVIISVSKVRVTIGGVAATNVNVVNSTTITATVPANSVGAKDVVVYTPNSENVTLSNGFTYNNPTIDSVSPNTGSTFGDQEITISGSNFATYQPVVFESTGTDQSYTVPAGVTSIKVKMWGAGGGGSGNGDWSYPFSGGGGGYTSADLEVTPGQVLNVVVGAAGIAGQMGSNWGAYGGGGQGCISGTDCRYSAGGGGRSAIQYSGEDLVTAGGGGGSGVSLNTNDDESGGAGGGTYGENGKSAIAYALGLGGTILGGGAGGIGNTTSGTAGTQYQGGHTNMNSYGGGGGGGYYGGGAGGFYDASSGRMGGGGGGSGFIAGAGVTNGYMVAGSGTTQAKSSDADNLGAGAGGAAYTTGKHGKVIIIPSAYKVSIGGIEAKDVNVIDSNTIKAIVPVNSIGTKDLVITNYDETTVTKSNAYTYTGSSIDSITPNFGPATGGTSVTITGSQLTANLDTKTFDYTGRDQIYVVPEGVTTVYVKQWGGGGGGGDSYYWGNGYAGGGGGYSSSEISVTPGQMLTVMVGAGGVAGRTSNFANFYGGGGNNCLADCNYGGQGGGRSAIRVGGEDILTAGGGGGGGVSRSNTLSQVGGAGGGLAGQAGISQSVITAGGKGGTQGAGGAAGVAADAGGSAGSKYTGGNTYNSYGGSGGGGWYGGGAGSYQEPNTMGGGGGGSGYIGAVQLINPVTIAGNYNVQANSTDPDNNGAGAGGAANTAGMPGKVIVTAAPTAIYFGSDRASNVKLVDSTTLTALTPASTPGTKDVSVNTPDGLSDTLPSAFTFMPPPTVNSIVTGYAKEAGGSELTINGDYFQDTPIVKIDGVDATSVTFVNSNTLTIIAPAHSTGAVDLYIENPDGGYTTSANGVIYVEDITSLDSVDPNIGATVGGENITINGTNFFPDNNLVGYWNFDETSGSSVNEITHINHSGLDGTVSGTSIVDGHAGKARYFNYGDTFNTTESGLPYGEINNITISVWSDPRSNNETKFIRMAPDPEDGSNRINTHFTWTDDKIYFDFGNIFAGGRISVPWNGAWTNQMAHWVFISEYGVGHRIYRNGVLIASDSSFDKYFNDGTKHWSIGPWAGYADELKIYDKALTEQEVLDDYNSTSIKYSGSVAFGGANATNLQYVNSSTLLAVTPAHASGTVDVVLNQDDGQSATLTNSFIFGNAPTITNVTPTTLPIAGGTTVTITGTNFENPVEVKFGGVDATSINYIDSTTLEVVAPANVSGYADVKVINPTTLSYIAQNAVSYIDPPPTIDSISPTSGYNTGGTTVTINGTNFVQNAGGSGTGVDGAVTITSNKNINTDAIASGRTCADAINYSVVALTENTATLSNIPAANCLTDGDEILLINLQGSNSNNTNVGNYEFLRVSNIVAETVTFTTNKTNNYGDGADDTNLGISAGTQRVMIQRIPNYSDVTVNALTTLTASAWDGTKGGVLFFRAKGNLNINGYIDMSGKGYRGGHGMTNGSDSTQGESYGGLGSANTNPNLGGGGVGTQEGNVFNGSSSSGGGGGSYGSSGSNGVQGPLTVEGTAGNTYGTSNLTKMYLGSGGGGGGAINFGLGSGTVGGNGGNGGGIVLISAGPFTLSGSILNNGSAGINGNTNGAYGGSGGGGGAGGSTLINSPSMNLGTNLVTATGGSKGVGGGGGEAGRDGGDGGSGIIATYSTSSTGTTSPNATQGSLAGSAVISVLFDSDYATNVTFISSTTLTVETPAHANGVVDVTLNNGNGQTVTLNDAFTFTYPDPTISVINPNTGVNTGGTNVTITGTNFVKDTESYVTNGLISYWSMDEQSGNVVYDNSTNDLDGTATGTSIVSGQLRNARSFDGSSYVSVSDNSLLTPSALTLEAWINPTNFNNYMVIAGKFPWFSDYSYQMSTTPSGKVRIDLSNNGSAYQFLVSNTSLTQGVWQHVGFTWDGTTVYIYINGVQDSASLNYSGSPSDNGVTFDIGRPAGGSPGNLQYFVGSIDNVMLYNRALTSIELLQNYNSTGIMLNDLDITFGGNSASNVHLVDSTTITATTPAHVNGIVDVVVHNGNALTATLVNGFTFQDPIASDPTVAPNNFRVQKLLTSSAPASETYDLQFDWDAAQFADQYNLYRSTDKTIALFQDTCSLTQIMNNHRAGELSSVAPLCETTLQQVVNTDDTTSWVKMAQINEPTTTYTINWSTLQSTLTADTYYFVLRAENNVNESAYSTMLVVNKQHYAYNGTQGNTSWISIPYNSPYTKASDIVTEIEGGVGSGTNTKINTISLWRAGAQDVESYKYNSALNKWVGTDFSINAGDGIAFILSGNTSNFAWTVAGNDTVNQKTFTLNATKPNLNWMSVPITTKFITANDIVNILEGGTGSNTNQKIKSVSIWDANTQSKNTYSYDSGSSSWIGTNFTLTPGVGISLELSGNSSPVNWTPYLVINPNN